MKRKIIIGSGVFGAVILLLFVVSLFHDPDNVRISAGIYCNTQRKDILDRKGKYEIPPKVVDYCKVNNVILVKWNPQYPIPAIYDKYDYGYSDNVDVVLYWVVDLKKEEQVGPMEWSEFVDYCDSKGIDVPF